MGDSFKIMEGIQHAKGELEKGTVNEPVQRTFENILSYLGVPSDEFAPGITVEDRLKYLYDVVAWMLIELDTNVSIGVSEGLTLAAGDTFDVTQAINQDDTELSIDAGLDQVRLLAVDRVYLLKAYIQVEFTNLNDDATYQWFDVTNGVFVGTPITLFGRQGAGNNPVYYLSNVIPAPTDLELRVVAGSDTVPAYECRLEANQSPPNNPPPTPPGGPASQSMNSRMTHWNTRNNNFVGPWPP
jgi:hypothetical protein